VAKLRAEVYYLEPDSPPFERSCPNPRLDRALHGVTSLKQPCTLTRGNLPKHTFLVLMLLFVAGGSASSPSVPSDAQYKHHDFWQRQLSTSSWTPVQANSPKVAADWTHVQTDDTHYLARANHCDGTDSVVYKVPTLSPAAAPTAAPTNAPTHTPTGFTHRHRDIRIYYTNTIKHYILYTLYAYTILIQYTHHTHTLHTLYSYTAPPCCRRETHKII
jgi:hypothetical protein